MVWSAQHMALAPQVLRPPADSDCAPVSAVAISACGNYCVIGLENGTLHRFNLQSQLYRGPIPKPPELADADSRAQAKAAAKAGTARPVERAHVGRVCGVE